MAAQLKSSDKGLNSQSEPSQSRLLPPSVFAKNKESTNLALHPPQVFKFTGRSPAKAHSSAQTSDNVENIPPSQIAHHHHTTSPVRHLTKHSSYSETNVVSHQQSNDEYTALQRQLHQQQQEWRNELEKLRTENFKLQLKDEIASATRRVMGDGDSHTSVKTSTQPLELLINKQLEEINTLKSQMSEMRLSHTNTVSKLEATHSQAVKALENQLTELQSDNRRLSADYQQLEEQASSKQRCNDETSRHLREESAELQSRVSQLISDLSSKDECVKSLRAQLTALQQKTGEAHRWPALKAELESRLSLEVEKRQELSSEVECLSQRVEALQEILKAQQEGLRSVAPNSEDRHDEDRLQVLLDRWRDKVFQLLVQQKSSEISNKREASRQSKEIDRLQASVNRLNCLVRERDGVIKERDTQVQQLNACKQALQLAVDKQTTRSDGLQAELSTANQKAAILTSGLADYHSQFSSFIDQLQSKSVCTATQLDNRLISANKLLEQFRIRETELRAKLASNSTALSNLQHDNSILAQENQKLAGLQQTLLRQHNDLELKDREIEQLKDVRDSLQHHQQLQLKQMSIEVETQWKKKMDEAELTISDLRRDLAKTIVSLRRAERQLNQSETDRVQQVERLTNEMSEKCNELTNQLASVQTERNIIQSNSRLGCVKLTSPAGKSLASSPALSPVATKELVCSTRRLVAECLGTSDDEED